MLAGIPTVNHALYQVVFMGIPEKPIFIQNRDRFDAFHIKDAWPLQLSNGENIERDHRDVMTSPIQRT